MLFEYVLYSNNRQIFIVTLNFKVNIKCILIERYFSVIFIVLLRYIILCPCTFIFEVLFYCIFPLPFITLIASSALQSPHCCPRPQSCNLSAQPLHPLTPLPELFTPSLSLCLKRVSYLSQGVRSHI